MGNPYGYGYGVDFGWIWIFFREKFWSGVDNEVKIPKCLQNTYCPYSFLTVWNNGLFIRRAQNHRFFKLDVGISMETGNFLPKNGYGWIWGIFYRKIRIWMDMDPAERSGVEWVSEFWPVKGSNLHTYTCWHWKIKAKIWPQVKVALRPK